MRWWLLIPLLKFTLAHRPAAPTGGTCPILLQRAAHLAPEGVAVGAVPAEDNSLSPDHDGFLSQASLSKATSWSPTRSRGEALIDIPAAGVVTDRVISFISVQDSFFHTNLGKSSLWVNRAKLPHQWILLDNLENVGISRLYADAQVLAKNDLLVFLHPDVLLPEDWYAAFIQKLQRLEAMDPNWGVLGTAGVPLGWSTQSPGSLRIATSITDCFSDYKTGIDNLQVQSLDEHLLVIRRNGSLIFDAELPGFDLYGTDIVLSARRAGMKAYLLNIPVLHKLHDAQGKPYKAATWFKKASDPLWQARGLSTRVFVQRKWCDSGFLPVYGTFFDIPVCASS